MAKLTRKTFLQFGSAGLSTFFGQFGSKEAGSPVLTKDPSVIQSLAAWVDGWQTAVVGANKAPYLEDMNGLIYVLSYMIAYMFQEGVPEWDSATMYYIGSLVQSSTGQRFMSLQDLNQGNILPVSGSTAQWQWISPPSYVKNTATIGALPKVSVAVSDKGPTGSAELTDSKLADDGSNIVIAAASGYGLKFQDGTVQTTASVATNVVSTQSPPSAYAGGPTRLYATPYQNTGPKPRFVSIVVSSTASGGCGVFCDTNNPPTTPIAAADLSAISGSTFETMFFIVLPGSWYEVKTISGGGSSVVSWTEWT